jgi:hypothetical protein
LTRTREHPFATESICLSTYDHSGLMDFLRDDVLYWSAQPAQAPEALGYIHVYLALTEDCAAIGMSHVLKPKTSVVDFALRIVPPRHGQIDFAKIREGILMLRGAGVRLVQVSVDSFQSVDGIQILTKAGSTRR